MSGKAPTVYDVAARDGVSIATVSRVLRRPDDVRPETRERVLAAVRELGYVPSAAARGLAGRRTGVLGLLLPEQVHEHDAPPGFDGGGDRPTTPTPVIDDRGGARPGTSGLSSLYYDEVVRGAEDEAWQRGFALLVSAGRGSSRDALLDDIAGRVDGLLVMASTVPDDLVVSVARRVPVAVIAGGAALAGSAGIDRVIAANADGMHALVARMLSDRAASGRPVRRAAYLSGPADSPDDAARRGGFDRAIAEATPAGTAPRVEALAGDFSEQRGRDLAAELLRRSAEEFPDALVCANDQTALGVLAVLGAAGVDVPGRVVVTGFDGVDAGRFSVPRLSTVRQPMGDLGRVAVRSVVERLADARLPGRETVLPVEVLLRESCPPF